LPQEVVDARNQRLKRASDISLKKVYLAKPLQAQQTPYLSYMQVSTLQLRALAAPHHLRREMPVMLHYGCCKWLLG